MAAYTANRVAIENGKNTVIIYSGEPTDNIQYGDFLVVGDFAPVQINRTYKNSDNLPVIELVKPWKKSNQIETHAIVIPTTLNFRDTVTALKNANTLINDNMRAMQDWQTKEGLVSFSNVDGTETVVKTLKQMELDFLTLLEDIRNNTPTDPQDPTVSFDVDKIVMLGASITNHSTSSSTIPFMQAYIKNKYGKDVTIINEAVSGESSLDLANRCDALFDQYANQPKTAVYLHIGGGDIDPSSKFLDQGGTRQEESITSLNYIYDSAENRGIRIMQAALTFRDYNSNTLKQTPDEQKAHELGSYTYTRDWIVPIMKERTPQLLDANDWPIIDMYNLTRNHYGEWVDPYQETDRVHSSDMGKLMVLKYAVDSILSIASAQPLAPLPQRDFNVAYPNATGSLDFVAGFGRNIEIAASSANINWVARDRPPIAGTEPVYLDNIIDVNGAVLDGLKLYSYVNGTLRDGVGNVSDPTNDTASLLNSVLLQSCLSVDIGSGMLCVVIEGLEPNKWYEISFNAGGENDSSTTRESNIQFTNEDNDPFILNCQATPPEDNLIVSSFVTNSYGEALIVSSEENTNKDSVMGGLRIRTL